MQMPFLSTQTRNPYPHIRHFCQGDARINFDFFLTPKILGLFWEILGLKYVLIDMWANDQNEMVFFYFQP
jgi:hypothetical protein